MHDSKVSFINLSNVFHSPKLATNLVSVGQLVDDVNSVYFSANGCIIQDEITGRMTGKGHKVGWLFVMKSDPSLQT